MIPASLPIIYALQAITLEHVSCRFAAIGPSPGLYDAAGAAAGGRGMMGRGGFDSGRGMGGRGGRAGPMGGPPVAGGYGGAPGGMMPYARPPVMPQAGYGYGGGEEAIPCVCMCVCVCVCVCARSLLW